MSKYSFEFRLKVVKEYLEGETGGYKSIAKKYDVISDSLIRYWVNDYEKYGEEGLRCTGDGRLCEKALFLLFVILSGTKDLHFEPFKILRFALDDNFHTA